MSVTEVWTHSEAETAACAAKLANRLSAAPCCITLTGDLGAGKTTFARGFIRALVGGEIVVQSPTFTLIQPYEYKVNGDTKTLQHMDLYRIEHASELVELGMEELLAEHMCLIEWPEIAELLLPEPRIRVHIEQVGDLRKIMISE